jgi:outer membrane protein OmpA-like peptidoglycan-associated protein
MIKVGERLTVTVSALLAFVLATSGCASKKYVSQQIAPVNQRLNQFEKKTDDRLAWLNNKVDRDVSQLNERVATTDLNLAKVAAAAQSAQGSASRAMESADAAKIAVDSLQTDMSNALNYKLVDRADVLFGFDKADLTPEAKATLDNIANKYRAQPRGIVELAGFTDPRGTANYNLELSRRRAWAVQRYLVNRDVPTRVIHMVGLGKQAPPEGLSPESTDGGSRDSRYRQDRRVNIRLYGASDIGATSSGSE